MRTIITIDEVRNRKTTETVDDKGNTVAKVEVLIPVAVVAPKATEVKK